MGQPRELLRGAVRAHRRDLVRASLLYTGHQVGEALVPVIIGAVIGQAIAHGGWPRIVLWLGVLALDFLALSACYRFGARASMRAKQGSAHVARMWLVRRSVRPEGGLDQPPGDLASRASSDAARVGAYAGTVAYTVAACVVLVVATVLLLRFSPILAAVILVGTVVLMLVQDRLAGLLRRRAHVEQRGSADATAQAEDLVRGLRVLRGIGAEEAAATNYRRSSRTALAGAVHAASAESALAAAAALVTGLYLAVIVGVGGWLALSGHLGLGPLVSALGLSQFILGPMRTVAGFSAVRARALASAARIGELLEEGGEPAGPGSAASPPAAAGDIRFNGVELAPGRTASFTAPVGSLTGVVLDDPAAAAGLVALLGRERDAAGGAVTVADVPIERWPLEALRAAVLVSPHDAVLFAGTVADNIAVRAADAPTVERATWAAFADQVIETLPAGAQTEVGDRAQRLSGGQRQRVALARALAADPPVLVLHDPTTSIDAATEDELARRLRRVRAGRTTLVVTSSPALLARCDQVVVVDERGVRVGGHAQLVAEDAGYRERVGR